jgi:quinoprotein glucose dehydrogenase
MAITVEPTFEQSRSRVMSGSRRVALLGVLVFTVGCAPTPIQSNVRPPDTAIEGTASDALKPKAATQAEAMAALLRGEWPAYGGTYASAKYSPLDQINAANVATLTIAWRWTSPDHAIRATTPGIDPSMIHQGTPIMVNGVLYTSTSLSQVAAIDAATGQTKWVFDPGSPQLGMPTNLGWIHRGVAYWRDGADERIIMLTGHAFMIALDAKTGRPLEGFGNKGLVDLTEGLGRPVPSRRLYGHTSPPVIVRDMIVVGSSVLGFPVREAMPVGDVRGFDIRTGQQLWTFRAVPGPGEVGHETWENDSWKTVGNTNVWTLMSADEELGYVYLPFSPPANDYYGGHRHGDNLFSDALVCLDVRTGKRVWHYQLTRHDIWDYDLPAAPNLIDVTVDGRRVKAVAQVTKQGHVFVFDRVTGTPLWPIEDRPVPDSSVPGEKTAATQPFPTKPAPVEIQGVREDDLIDLTPELRHAAREIIARYDYGPLYTPPSERGTILMPGVGGGPSWSGAGWDPETQMYYVTTVRFPSVVTLRQPSGESADRYVGSFTFLAGPGRLPLFKPPWGSVVAIDMSTGEHRWRAPVGSGKPFAGAPVPLLAILAAIPDTATERLGWPRRSFVLVTKSLLLVVQQGYQNNQRPAPFTPRQRVWDLNNLEPKLYAYDKTSGRLLAEIPLPANAGGAPMTYMAGGKQYVAFPVGGANIPEELIALSLP